MNGSLFIDYYDLMQISPNADDDTVQQMFRHLAKKWHPDHHKGDPERFKLLVEAQRILTNPETRAAYDLRYQKFWESKWNLAANASDGRTFVDDNEVREGLRAAQEQAERSRPGRT